MAKYLSIRGAREHNLKNINIDLPRDLLTVITGVSGSGKSSLAFDTIYAEGQRRYVESLSSYARQFLEQMGKPDYDTIEGLAPAISIEQKTTSRNPRSTVGTVTEIYDYMRLLYARIGVPYSPATGLPIEAQTVSQMVDKIQSWPEGQKILILAPIVRGRKGEYRKEIEELKKQGFQRIKVDGTLYQIEDVPALEKNLKHTIEVVVDRLIVRSEMDARLPDSLETALKLGHGLVVVENHETQEQILFSEKYACPVSGFTIEEIEPRLFSFNNPFGACPVCDGLGSKLYFDPALVVPDSKKALADGAIDPWVGSTTMYYVQTLECLSRHYKFKMNAPWKDLPGRIREIVLYGSGDEAIIWNYDDGYHPYNVHKPFEGVIPNLERRWAKEENDKFREDVACYQNDQKCSGCEGKRLKPEALCVKLDGLDIADITRLSIEKAARWFGELPQTLTQKQQEIARQILKEINERLHFLNNVGLEYLSLDRMSGTLSGGESQRIRLASQIGSGLTGVLYILDEPSIGLHQRDNDRLLETLKRLRDLGNTVIVVEHDEDAIRMADYLVDMGPGAGAHGGQIVAQGRPDEVISGGVGLTAQYLLGTRKIDIPEKRRKPEKGKCITLRGVQSNNLKKVSVDIPLGIMTCITGVSGSGKSSLIIETLYKILAKHCNGTRVTPGAYDKVEGLHLIDKIVEIDQSPIGRTPRSNPATYIGAFTPVREWFAALPDAKVRGYGPGRFSFNVKGGRCEACQGDGLIKIEMHFLPDIYVTCDVCHGKRFNRETLEIKFKGKTIADILDMTVEDGAEFFKNVPSIYNKLITLARVGLDYIHIGQSATTLSGGEAQRVKLAKELSKRATGQTIYILDEPTTGLHFEDIRKLLEVLQQLVDQGNSVLIIEHNLDVIKTADWIIDLGPEGGDRGGEIVGVGTPEQLCKIERSYTGQYLKRVMMK